MIFEAVDSLKESASLGLADYLSYRAFMECAECEKGRRILMFALVQERNLGDFSQDILARLAREIFRVRMFTYSTRECL